MALFLATSEKLATHSSLRLCLFGFYFLNYLLNRAISHTQIPCSTNEINAELKLNNMKKDKNVR